MKRKWNRLLALLLTALMISSDLSGLIPRAQAAPATPPLVTNTGDKNDFRNAGNGRPNLFVNFLGDNNLYIYTANGAHAGLNGAGTALAQKAAASLDTVSAPAPYDQGLDTNPTGPGNTWTQYKRQPDCDFTNVGDTVFWVGLGVDRTELLELADDGLASLEAGFYYDDTIIEPYVDMTLLPTGVTAATATADDLQKAYQATIAKANINNPNYPANTQWSDKYTVVRAVKDIEPPETDPVTREETHSDVSRPSVDDILRNAPLPSSLGTTRQWKMTYVSLELQEDVKPGGGADRRLAGCYVKPEDRPTGVLDSDGDGTADDPETVVPIVPDGAAGDEYVKDNDPTSGYDYNYLLLIPFRLKAYGDESWTPIRLVRDATHFSIGGATWGVDQYGAWERTTTRNPAVAGVADTSTDLGVTGHPARDLKLMTNFVGDLNLFKAGVVGEVLYDAMLHIENGGGSLNHAVLSVDGDPSTWPVWVDTDGSVIENLQSGQGMRLDVHIQENYVTTISVRYYPDDGAGGSTEIYHEYVQILDGPYDDAYTFVMPAFEPSTDQRTVHVYVTFTYKDGDYQRVYLSELPQPGDVGHAVGNEATIRTSLDYDAPSTSYNNTTDTETINSYSPTGEHPNYNHPDIHNHPDRTPSATAKKNQYVEIEIATHADYVAMVRIFDFYAQQFVTSGLDIQATGVSGVVPDTSTIPNPAYPADPTAPQDIPDPAKYGMIEMPQGGTIYVLMGSQDLDVEITYEKGQRHQATLEVYNTNDNAVDFDLNTAQLVYDRYDDLNLASKAYSGVIYHKYYNPAAIVSPAPSASPDPSASADPSASPAAGASASPSAAPSAAPSATPSAAPSATPSATPSAAPGASPSATPSASPGASPNPSAKPSPDYNEHRVVHPTKGSDKLPWISSTQASTSGSLGGDTGRTGKAWNPKNDLAVSEDQVVGGKTVMALLSASAQKTSLASDSDRKADFKSAVNGLDFATVAIKDGATTLFTGLRKSQAGELYGDPDIAVGTDLDAPTAIDALWEIRTAIDADTTTGGLKDTYHKTVSKTENGSTSVIYTYYDLTPAQLQAYLLEIFEAREVKAQNDLAYRIANRRYLTLLVDYNRLKDIPAYAGMAALQAPAKNLSTTVTNGKREYQDIDYKDTYLAGYNTYLDDYEQYLADLEANAGTGGAGAPTAPTSYPGATAPTKKVISLKTDADAVTYLKNYTWVNTPVPTEPLDEYAGTDMAGNTIETRAGRTVYIVMEADSAYELDTVNIDVHKRGPASAYATGVAITTPATVTPVPVTGYKNVYSFTMPNEDCVVRVSYKLRGTRKLNITYKGAAGLDDNEAIVEAYTVSNPAAVTPTLSSVTNKGYTLPVRPYGGTYDALNDIYKPDPIENVFKGSIVTVRAKAAKGYEVKSVEALNSDSTTITVTERIADDPADGKIYTFIIAESRDDDIELIITYGLEVDEEYTATIQSTSDGANDATWYVVNTTVTPPVTTTPKVISPVRPSTHLTGHVTVAPGYYIKSVTAWGASGNYPFTITGNGYNNGYGTAITGTEVPVEIYVDMPHEDLIVDVEFAKGPPEPAPGNTLTLIVKDDDNEGETVTDANGTRVEYAPNWAKARVYDSKPASLIAYDADDPTLDTSNPEIQLPSGAEPKHVVGKNAKKGADVLTDRKYVDAGKWVLVDFSAYVTTKLDTTPGAAPGATVIDPAKSYYVSSVTVGPENLGIALVWEGPTQVGFYMPAGSTAVTVSFSKYPANGKLPDYLLTVRETYTDLNPGAPTPPSTNEDSYITRAQSETIGSWSTVVDGSQTLPARNLDWRVNPELVPPLGDATLSPDATGAATAGEEVIMTFDVDEGDGTADYPGWYYKSVVLISNGAATRLTGDVQWVSTRTKAATKLVAGVPTPTTTKIVTYQVKFHMPTSAAEFVVHYRKGPRPTQPDYAFTLSLDDPHNVFDTANNKWDDNNIVADFNDPTGATAAGAHPSLQVGRAVGPDGTTPTGGHMTAVQYVHSGDIITLKTTLAAGYHMEYMIVNPAGLKIIPVWTDANTATFIMPTEGVAVAARVVKGPATQYTANLILRYDGTMPTGKTINDIGKGTFVLPDPLNPGGTIGLIDDDTTSTPNVLYPTAAIYSTVQDPGTVIPYDLYAYDGYYIDRITVEPVILGVKGSLSGSNGYQDGEFTMPYASVNVNVWFKSGWPDEIPYDLTLRAHDSSVDPSKTPNTTDNNYIALRTVSRGGDVTLDPADKDPVFGGQTKVIDQDGYVRDRDIVIVDIHAITGANPGDPSYYVNASSIRIADSHGNTIPWWYVPGGIAFVQPPRSVTVDVTFRLEDPANPRPKYKATLHVSGFQTVPAGTQDKDILDDYVLLSADAANTRAQTTAQAAAVTPPPVAVDTHLAEITDLYHGDTLELATRPGAVRYVAAAYAVTPDGTVLPIYGYDAGGALTANRAQFVPGKAGTPELPAVPPATVNTPAVAGTVTKGAFAMPESDVDVYVRYAAGVLNANDLPVELIVSGPTGSGYAKAELDDINAKPTDNMTVTAPDMDVRFALRGTETVVTFKPDTANGYDITSLEVLNKATGARVPYEWISVLQDPEVIDNSAQDNTNLWTGTAPAPGITHPTWKPNPDKQIKLTVPSGGVTVHVTYGKVPTTAFRAQVVVNDPLQGTANASKSKNNAWLSQKTQKVEADDDVLKKIQYAKPGEWVDLDITVHPGFRIEYVKVIPQSYGITPGLPLGTDVGNGVIYYLHDQNTGFVMPGGDCTVYVKFVADALEAKNVTLKVEGLPTGNNLNQASMTIPTGNAGATTKGPVYVGAAPQSHTARPVVDWVTVDYSWDTATSSIDSISVTIAGTTTNVPFTQVEDPASGKGQLVFPMVNADVIVNLHYRNDPTPVGQMVVLHVIDKDKNTAQQILLQNDGIDDWNYGRLIYTPGAGYPSTIAQDTGKFALTPAQYTNGKFENTTSISVPAGQWVNVIAASDYAGLDGNGPVYIESAYVLFEQSGQMIHFNMTPDSLFPPKTGPGYSGLHAVDDAGNPHGFVVHPGRNDVYVTLTRKAPTADEHAAVLMIRSPSADTQSEAGIHADQTVAGWNDAAPSLRDKVRANDPTDSHAYVVAKQGDKITVSVEPASGYIIDYIQITPLGFPLDTDPVYQYTRTGNTITFDMPHCNVAITVYLKRGSNQDYYATLHYIQDPNAIAAGLPPMPADYAKLTWTQPGGAKQSIWADANTATLPAGAPVNAKDPLGGDWRDVETMIVKEGSTVTLDVTLDQNTATGGSDLILAAFVVWKDKGSIVSLKPIYPGDRTILTGLEGVEESVSTLDNTLADATANFTMPMGDVEVYVVVTTVPPAASWHTVALVATDHSPVENNSGKNEGDLWSDPDPVKRVAISDKSVTPGDGKPTIAWITVTETDTFHVLPRPGPGYRFDDPAVMTGNDGTVTNLSTIYANFLYDVSNILCNQVVRIDFESGDDLELTVEIEDPDNPSNGTVEQVVTVDPPGTTPPDLRLTSNSVAGSYQVISGITAGGDVELKVTPHDGYAAYAQLYYYDGTVANIALTDGDGDGVWDGKFQMPNNNARVVVTFFLPYKGTLTLVNRISGDTTGQAEMKAQKPAGDSNDKLGLTPLTVHSLSPTDTFQRLPNGTTLDARVTSDLTGRTVKGLLTVNGITTILAGEASGVIGDPDHYKHTIDRANAEITLILEKPTEHPKSHLAVVNWVNKPAATGAPEIEDTKGTPQVRGADKTWTTADETDPIQVTVNVPYGYEAVITATGGVTVEKAGAPVTAPLTGPAGSTDPDEVYTLDFTMPANDVVVTVTYQKVIFDLSLRVIDGSPDPTKNATVVTPTAADVVSGGPTLTLNGEGTVSMTVKKNGAVAVSATPDTTAAGTADPNDHDPHISAIYYRTDDGRFGWIEPTELAEGVASSKSPAFTMPDADTQVTVIYDKHRTGGPGDEPWYVASVELVNTDGKPGNRAVSIIDMPDSGLPEDSPYWTGARPGSSVKVSYQAEEGYYAVVTAHWANDPTKSVAVLQMGSPNNGTATINMPAGNVVITVTFVTTAPTQSNNVALQLVGHKADANNKAQTTNFTDSTQLKDLKTDGTTATHPPRNPAYTDATDPVETVKPLAYLGDDLRTLANWANGSQVVRMTVQVRHVDKKTVSGVDVITNITETPEVDLLVSKYVSAATSRVPTPITSNPDDEIVIRVYYGNIYKAVFHLVGDESTDDHTATDVVSGTANPLTYTTAYTVSDSARVKPIEKDLERIEGYQGDGFEDIQTSVAVNDADRRVVDVIWESALTGAASAIPNGTLPANGNGRYDFTMPACDVDFYAFFEKEPKDPKDRAYVAKVAFAPDSDHLSDAGNDVTIENKTNDKASHGKFWTEAKDQDEIVVTVKVAAGYQAEIITTKIDDETKLGLLPEVDDETTSDPTDTRPVVSGDDYHYYISRTRFIYNLPDGKEATFTMPKDTDATVTIRFYRGYDLTMRLEDKTTFPNADPVNVKANNKAVSEVMDPVTTTEKFGKISNVSENPGTGGTKVETENTVSMGTGPYKTELKIDRKGDVNNTVKVYPTAKPSVHIMSNGSTMTGIPDNTQLTIDASPAPGYVVDLHVYAEPGHSPIFSAVNVKGDTLHSFLVDSTVISGGFTGVSLEAEFHTITAGASLSSVTPAFAGSNVTVEGLNNLAQVFGEVPEIAAGLDNMAQLLAANPFVSGANDLDTIYDLPGNLKVDTDVTLDKLLENTDVTARLFQTTPFTGTHLVAVEQQNVPAGAAADVPMANSLAMLMGYEDTLGTTELTNAHELYAAVQLEGERDVTGNTAKPVIDKTNYVTPVLDGTKTDVANVDPTAGANPWRGDVIDLAITIQKGYIARVSVRRDDDDYLNNPNDPSKWNYLDVFRYQFSNNYDYDDGGTIQSVTDDLFITEAKLDDGKAGEREAGETEVIFKAESKKIVPQSAFPDSVCGEQHFRFYMPRTVTASDDATAHPVGDPARIEPGNAGYLMADTECSVTIIVTFEKINDMPQPFDPRNDDLHDRHPSFLKEGFIYGENRGDFAIIEIPTLAKENEADGKTVTNLYDTDNYDAPVTAPNKKDPDKAVRRFSFYLYSEDAAGKKSYTKLEQDKDIILAPYDPDDPDLKDKDHVTPYNYYKGEAEGMWTSNDSRIWKDTSGTGDYDFTGSKFKIYPTEPDPKTGRTAGAEALYKMLNNEGSLESYKVTKPGANPGDPDVTETVYYTRLVVVAEDAAGNVSDYTEVWIRPWFALGVKVISYGPTHPLEGELYRLMTQDELDYASGYLLEDANHKKPGETGYVNTPNTSGIAQELLDKDNFKHYKWDEDVEPAFTDMEVVDEGSGKWLQILRIRSSDLLGPFDSSYDPDEHPADPTASPPVAERTLLANVKPPRADYLTYALVLKKASNLTYTRVNIDLDPASYPIAPSTDLLTDYYETVGGAPDPKTRTFMVQNVTENGIEKPIQLIAGDVDENGQTKIQDYDAIYDFVYRTREWNTIATEPTEPAKPRPGAGDPPDSDWIKYDKDMAEWAKSIYNPDSLPYHCDLDGDRKLTVVDLNIVNTRFNYNRDETHYNWFYAVGNVDMERLPFGMGARDTGKYDALFSLDTIMEGELLSDAYWDEPVNPEETEGVPMETLFVDGEGRFWLILVGEDDGATEELPEWDDSIHDEVVEIPLGEEVLSPATAEIPSLTADRAELPEEPRETLSGGDDDPPEEAQTQRADEEGDAESAESPAE